MRYRSPIFGDVSWPRWHDALVVAGVIVFVVMLPVLTRLVGPHPTTDPACRNARTMEKAGIVGCKLAHNRWVPLEPASSP